MPKSQISLAEWSLHRTIESGQLANLDFPRVARQEFDIGAIELVNALMEGHGPETIRELKRRADDHDVKILLIMCDDEGDLSALDRAERQEAAENHFKWLDAAAALGCEAIRINTGPEDEKASPDPDAVKRCAESCEILLDRAEPLELNVLIENHGGISSRIDLVLELMSRVPHARFGTLPDFGNFPLEDPGCDPYDFVEKMMARALAVSAKCFDIIEGEDGRLQDTRLDFHRMLDIVRSAGYVGHLGIEYEGDSPDEFEGVRRAKKLIEQTPQA